MAVSTRPAGKDQYEPFVALIQREARDYFERSLAAMEMPMDTFRRLFRAAGTVSGIYEGTELAGLVWAELRGDVLHIHGLVLDKAFQGRGIGTRVLDILEVEHRGKASAIEIGVYASNERARAFFERRGYRVARTREDLGFQVLRKPLA